MAEQNRIPIPGSEKRPVANAERIGDVHADERLEVTVHLKSQASDDLTQRVHALSTRAPEAREQLTREQFAERYGADPAAITRVEAFARTNGLSVVTASRARRGACRRATASP